MSNRVMEFETRSASGRTPGGADGPFDPTQGGPESGADWKETIENYIAANPGVSLGVALLAGVLLGWLIKRR